ncbi:MAG: hypothetical protein K2X07_09345 [Caulobacteraceae bacterium]|nr:hypothetical protein [Caulobacteraceae bacterium]
MEALRFFADEWAVISAAPTTFVIAIAIVSVVIWLVIDRLYSHRLGTKDATIEHLTARLEGRDDKPARWG